VIGGEAIGGEAIGLSSHVADQPVKNPLARLILSLRDGKLDPVAVAQEYLSRAAAQQELNAFRWRDPDRVLADARAAIGRGGLLVGVPIALKDNIDVAGIPTTSGSAVDAERVPQADAAVWRRLRDDAGAVLLGKAHLSEFAYRAHHPSFGPVLNPRDRSRATGGSSSGSAALVAAGIAPAAIGTDTGGSCRIPAAYCGTVGYKGTLGLVDTEGVVPLSRTMDHVGVLAASVRDAAIVFQAMTGPGVDLVDPDSLGLKATNFGRLRIGMPTGYLGGGSQVGVLRARDRAAEALRGQGWELFPIDVPAARQWRWAHRTILLAEAWEFHGPRLRGGAPYGPVFRAAIGAGSRIEAGRIAQARAIRAAAIDTLASMFERVDLLLTPTCPTVAPPADEGVRNVRYTRYTTVAAFCGVPAISIPAGTGRLGLPVGVQLMGPVGSDGLVLAAAARLEDALGSANGIR
jgi:aspartyl-tRNA(Asn)/glutamyl-tRNA(Gln) amidotransferase subunit A